MFPAAPKGSTNLLRRPIGSPDGLNAANRCRTSNLQHPRRLVGNQNRFGGLRTRSTVSADDDDSLGLGETSTGLVESSTIPNEDVVDNAHVEMANGKDQPGDVVPVSKNMPEEYVQDDFWIPHRWRVTAMIGLSFVLCNMDKVNMSVAVIPMAQDLGWSATSRGIVQSAFFFGYTLTQIPAGWLSTKIGGSSVLLAGVAIWSLGTLVAPAAAHAGFFLLCLSRALVGLGEGFAPSAATNVLAKHVPKSERSRAVAAVFGGLDLGSAVGLLVCGPLIRIYGWPCVFYLFAVIGLVWCLGWPLVNPEKIDAVMWRNKTSEHRSGVPTSSSSDNEKVPWGEFFKSAPVWAVITAHFCFNWGYYTLLSWLPSFFQLALELDVQNSSYLTIIPYVAMTLTTGLVGPAADSLVQSGVSLTRVRKLFQGTAFLGSALCMVACGILTPQSTAGLSPMVVSILVGLLSFSFAVSACARAGLYCNHQDLSPRFSSALLGVSNTAGAIPGILGVWSAGFLLDLTGSWSTALFYPIAATQVFGLLIYTLFASSKRQSWS